MNDITKTIRDPIHGDIEFKGLFLDLLEAPELQRLHSIKQLGLRKEPDQGERDCIVQSCRPTRSARGYWNELWHFHEIGCYIVSEFRPKLVLDVVDGGMVGCQHMMKHPTNNLGQYIGVKTRLLGLYT